MTDYSADLDVHLRRIARNSPSPWIPGIRLHPDDIEALPKAEPKPIWAAGFSGLMGTPIFHDETIARGSYEVATDEWIAAQARAREAQDLTCPTVGEVDPYRPVTDPEQP